MPTRINLNIRAPLQHALDQFLVFAPTLAPRGFDDINRRLTKDQAQEILRGLKAQLDNGRGGVKSGYLKIVNTTVAGNHMEIRRKGGFHAWLNRGRMESTNQALMTIVERSGLASNKQIETLRQYLDSTHKADTKTFANFLKTLALGEQGPIGTFIASHSADRRINQFNAALQAAGLTEPQLDPSSLPGGFVDLKSPLARQAALDTVARANPTATPTQLGRFANAWMKYPHGDEHPDLNVSLFEFKSLDELKQTPLSENIQSNAEFLTEAFNGMEERILPWIKQQVIRSSDSSARDSLALIAQHIAERLVIPSGNPQGDALRQSVAENLRQLDAQTLPHPFIPNDPASKKQLGPLTTDQSGDNSMLQLTFQSSADNAPSVIRNSSYSNSLLRVRPRGTLEFDRVNLDDSVLVIDPTTSRINILGLNTCSLERTDIRISGYAINEAFADRKDHESEAVMKARLELGLRWAGDSCKLIASIPDRYAGIKVNLAMDWINALASVGGSSKSSCDRVICDLISTIPELLYVPEVMETYKRSAESIFENAGTENGVDFNKLTTQHLKLAEKIPVAKAFLDQSETFKTAKLLASLSRSDADPRRLTLDERDRFVRVFLTMNEDARNRWLSAHSAVTAIALQPREGESALIDPSNDGPAQDANEHLIAAHRLLIKHPGIRAALLVWAQSVDYSITEDNHDAQSDEALLRTSLASAVILNGSAPAANAPHHAVVVRGETLLDFVRGQPINAQLQDMRHVYVLDMRALGQEAQNANGINIQNTQGMRKFDKARDTGIDPLLRQAVVAPGQNIVSTNLAYHFKTERLRPLFEQSIDGRRPISSDDAAQIHSDLATYWVDDMRVSAEYLRGLRKNMAELGIADTNANFSAYLFQLAAVFTRFSSVSAMGTDSESIAGLRGHAARLLNHANEIARQNPEPRLIPGDNYMKLLSEQLTTNQCADILSKDMMLPASRSKAPGIFDMTIPDAWRHWGNGNARTIQGVAP